MQPRRFAKLILKRFRNPRMKVHFDEPNLAKVSRDQSSTWANKIMFTSSDLDDKVAGDACAAFEPVQILQARDRRALALKRTVFAFLEISMKNKCLCC